MTVAGVTTSATAALPANVNYQSWHTIALERRGRVLVAEVSADRLRDATGTVRVTLPAGFGDGRIGAVSRSGAADVDNLGAAPLFTPVTTRVAAPAPGGLLPAYSDEFTGSSLGAGWSWVRGNPGGHRRRRVAGLADPGRRAGAGHQHRVGPGPRRAAGRLHGGDPAALRRGTRQPAGRADPVRERRPVRQARPLRPPGTTWEWGGAWSMPHRAPLRVGLVSMNTTGATGTFDYVRTYAQ